MNSTLALAKSDYEQEVGAFWGFGRGKDAGNPAWQPSQVTNIQADVKAGLRAWYYCGHAWSFMKPFCQITLPKGSTTVTLPDDFGGVDGGERACLTNTSLLFLQWLPFTGPPKVQQALSQLPNAVGITRLISVRPIKKMESGKMQRDELFFFPKADQDYTVTFPYFFTPNYLLDVKQPYAFGGVEHHEAIKESCLAAAEKRRGGETAHQAEFQRLLQLSMQIDRRRQPTNLGQNLDNSDRGNPWEKYAGHGWSNNGGGVTINGTLYT